MQESKRDFIFIIVALVLACWSGILPAQDQGLKTSSSSSSEGDDVLAVSIREALNQWMYSVRNLDAEFECRVYNRDFSNGKYGDRIADSGRHQFDFKRIGDHYRLNSIWYLTQETKKVEVTAVSTFDPRIGQSKSFGSNVAVQGQFGRVDVEHDLLIRTNRLGFWVGSYDGFSRYGWISSTLSKDEWELERSNEDQSVVLLTVPMLDDHGQNKKVGHRTLWLDEAKGYLPIRMATSTNDEYWRKESFRVEDSIQLNTTTWFPTSLVEELQTFALGENVISIFETKVSNVELGTVTEKDLELVFPENTLVIDVVAGVSYLANGQGGAIGKKRPIVGGLVAEADPVDENIQLSSNSYYSLIIMNLAVLAIIVGIWLIKRSGSKKMPTTPAD